MTGDELVYSCHRDLRRVYGYHINFNLYVYKLYNEQSLDESLVKTFFLFVQRTDQRA